MDNQELKQNKPDLSIIITPWNAKALLKACLDSIKASQTQFSYEVIVYDHGSVDGTLEMLEGEYPEVKLIRGGDVGFAAANNEGMRRSSGRYVLLLNADTVVEPNTLEEMVKLMDARPDIGMATCKVMLWNGQIDVTCHRSFPTPWVAATHYSGLSKVFPRSRVFAKYHMTYVSYEEEHEIEQLVGAFLITRREVIDEVGMLDENFYMYFEDTDWCYRAYLAGWKIYYYPKVSILHYKGFLSSEQSGKKKVYRPRPLWEFYYSMRRYYRKHYAHKYPPAFNALVYAAMAALYLAKSRGRLYRPPVPKEF